MGSQLLYYGRFGEFCYEVFYGILWWLNTFRGFSTAVVLSVFCWDLVEMQILASNPLTLHACSKSNVSETWSKVR